MPTGAEIKADIDEKIRDRNVAGSITRGDVAGILDDVVDLAEADVIEEFSSISGTLWDGTSSTKKTRVITEDTALTLTGTTNGWEASILVTQNEDGDNELTINGDPILIRPYASAETFVRIVNIDGVLKYYPDWDGTIAENTTPAAPTLTADDGLNTLSASHTLGTSQILVSENNGSYVAYSGAISVGGVDRPVGYWKFKIKAATGRNESSVVSSPVFRAVAAEDELIGVIYDKSSWSDLNDFNLSQPSSGTWSLSGSKIMVNPPQTVGGFATDNPAFAWADYASLDVLPANNDTTLKIEIAFKPVGVIPAANPGDGLNNIFGAMVMCLWPANSWLAANYFFSTQISQAGWRLAGHYNPTTTDQTTSSTALVLNNDIIKSVVQLGVASSFTSQNLNDSVSKSAADRGIPWNGFYFQIAPQIHNNQYYASCKFTIESIKITSSMVKNPQVLVVGDSKSTSAVDGGFEHRYPNLLADLLEKNVLAYGGGGSRSQDLDLLVDYLTLYEVTPQIVILNAGRNDLAAATVTATWQAKYISVVTKLKALNPTAKFIHLMPIPEVPTGGSPTNDQSSINTFINAQYPADYKFDPATNGWNASTMTSDSVHPNYVGAQHLAAGLQAYIDSI